MPWVEFLADFNWTPARDRRVTTAYKEGHRMLVTTACAKAAGARVKRVPTPPRSRPPEPAGG